MTLLDRTEPRRGNRAVFVSAGLHAAAFWGLMSTPAIELPKRTPSEYQQILDSRTPEHKITVYKFRKELPPVTPPKTAKADRRPLRADVKSNQAIVSSAEAKKRTQMVWTPSPDLAPSVPLESPNLIAVRLPEPGPKPFTAPPDIIRPPAAEIDVPPPPDIESKAALKKQFLPPPETSKPVPRRAQTAQDVPAIEARAVAAPDLRSPKLARVYRPPAALAPKLVSPVKPLEAPPELTAVEIASSALPKVKLPPKPYLAPVPARRGEGRTVARAGEAPEVLPSAALQAGAVIPGAKLPLKSYQAPAQPGRARSRSVTRAGEVPELPTSANLSAGASVPGVKLPPKMFPGAPGAGRGAVRVPALSTDTPEPLDMAVVGLKPAEVEISLPAASSPASFASGPKVNPKGADREAGAAGLPVPDLFIRGPKPANAADLIAQARLTPTSREMVAAAIRQGEPVMSRMFTLPAEPGRGATKVMSAPDPRMSGREVYMMAIQMPNLTSYSGSWLMWYAARTASAVAQAPLAPPVAHRKVDPKYVQAAADEHVQGNVRLACEIDTEGNVSRVELLQGVDARLNQTAVEALSKWQFYPATRNGDPVAVDVVVEIPFRLAPRGVGRGR